MESTNEIIVYYPGVWDCVHAGHLIILNEAKTFGDLVVGVCSDELNYRLKKKYSLLNQDERIFLLEGLGFKTKIYDNTNYHTHCYFDYFIHGPDFGEREDQKIFLKWCVDNSKTIINLARSATDIGMSTTEIIRRAQER